MEARPPPPTGVIIVALGYGANSTLLFWLGVFMLFRGGGADIILTAVAAMILSSVIIVLATGLWFLHRWAWIGMLIVTSLSVIFSLGEMPALGRTLNIPRILLTLGMLIYLLLPTTRTHFWRRT